MMWKEFSTPLKWLKHGLSDYGSKRNINIISTMGEYPKEEKGKQKKIYWEHPKGKKPNLKIENTQKPMSRILHIDC